MELLQIIKVDPGTLAVAAGLVFLNERFIELLVVPFWKKAKLDPDLLMYVALFTGGVLSFLAGVDFFGDMFQYPAVGLVVSALIVGGGSELLHAVIGGFKRSGR
jgi:hypothetical protein